ncbi:hypothetical protein [Citrobacter sp. W9]|uniref:hypothetical protein n=1 Tax=Citrobacter sp. W9 TaxID=2998573 RepID=UPI00227B3D53|nr:hypothetical protein [Citrobacter sp. W9]
MTALNKQAPKLSAAEFIAAIAKATELRSRDGRDAVARSVYEKVFKPLLDENLQLQRDNNSLEAATLAMRDDMRETREKLEAAERRIVETNQRNTELTAKIEPMDRRIAELEAQTVTVQLPADNAAESESPEDDATAWFDEGWNARGKADKEALIAAGIGVKGE